VLRLRGVSALAIAYEATSKCFARGIAFHIAKLRTVIATFAHDFLESTPISCKRFDRFRRSRLPTGYKGED
jgi:hypothetical protein